MDRTGKNTALTIFGYCAPALIVYSMMTIIPVIVALYLSLFDGIGFSNRIFVGFQNYKEIFTSREFWNALKNNLLYVGLCVIGQVGLAFLITILLTGRKIRGENVISGALFIPCILAPLVIGFIGMMIYNSRFGMINSILRSIKLDSLARDWLSDPKLVIFSLIAIHIWQWIGYYVVIFTAAYHGISVSVLESAMLDGAVGAKRMVYIIMPLLWDSVKVSVMLCIAGTMKVFDTIFVMTGGGPGKVSQVLSIYMFNNTFLNFRMNFGSAISVVIMMVSLFLIGGSRKLLAAKGDSND
jgi:raffinose/stachyose/melibiose transport system permease protein